MSGYDENVWTGWTAPIERLRADIAKRRNQSPSGHDQRALNRRTHRLKSQEQALERLCEHNPALYRGELDVTLSQQETDRLVTNVCSGSAGYALRDAQRYLVTGLALGIGELGWDIPVPAPMVLQSTETSNVTPESFERLKQYDALEDAFWRDLEAETVDSPAPDLVRDAGQLLFSIVFHSGVCSKFWLALVPKAIRQGAGLSDTVVWLDLGAETGLDNADSEDRRRRQFLAPVTQLLLRRWYRRWGVSWPTEENQPRYRPASRLLEQFAKHLCKEADLSKKGTEDCLSLSAANLSVTLPNVLFHYARSRHLGTPLIEHNWLRLLTDCKPTKAIAPVRVSGGRFSRAEEVRKVQLGHRYPEQSKRFGELRESIQAETVREAKNGVETFLEEEALSPILQLMGAWALHLLRWGGVAKGRLQPASVIRYLNWIRPLLNYADDLADPESLDEDSWQAIYDEIVANGQGVAKDRAGRLVAFHQFLEQVYGMPPVDVAGASGERQIDARIITPREYHRARRHLQSRAETDRNAANQEILLILGYRCGLRRGEALSRLFRDFPGMDDPDVNDVELLVRPNKNARIKSESGTRRLPLNLLLTDEELARLRAFYLNRRALVPGAAGSRPLFADAVGGHWPAATTHLFDPLTRLLQTITGDGRLRFHHLRHSFVTLTFLRLMESKPGEHLIDQWCRGDEGETLLPSLDQPLWRTAGLTDTGQSVWQLAMWSGHASPAVTLECYSHLLGWLTNSFLRQRQNPMLSLACQSALLSKSSAALEKWRHRQGLRDRHTSARELADRALGSWPASGRRRLLRLGDYDRLSQTVPKDRQSQTSRVGFMDPYQLELWSQMSPPGASNPEPRGLRAAGALLGISGAEAERWHSNAASVMAMRTARTRSEDKKEQLPPPVLNRPRVARDDERVFRPLDQKDLNRGNPCLETFPAPPKTRPGREHAQRYFNALVEWHDEAPEAALSAMNSVLNSVQRSDPRIRPRHVRDQISFYSLLRRLGLKSRSTIRVRHCPTNNKHVLKAHWAETFETEPRNVRCEEVGEHLKMGALGKSQVVVEPPNALYQRQNLFWDALRFALVSAYVVCADPS
ncbi:hypothetical protein C8D92_104106 [Tamilnaduibacter salinus]|uniref:Phage integrase family protein n=1 Tax=Tamilnaduibacter salinus TaxID=1484056 RepID=A0A2U1CXD5_9GAMM|nr:hypothetical protein [Tamilnaduibacter salinus]PVY76875.1 hypothetical protein C8D92_104106 [Tamilnaduibacter salinus]